MAEALSQAVIMPRVWPVWTRRIVHPRPLDGEIELSWLSQALEGEATLAIWEGEQGLVAPLSYRRHAQLQQAMNRSASEGWPVRLRRSGGGVVPQGEGILNVSLAFPCQDAPGDIAEVLYREFCQALARPLQAMGIRTDAQSVSGSFCDGRFNLAALDHATGVYRKVAGTAQYWRRANGRQAVLLHALVVAEADPRFLTAVANRFESSLESGRRYQAASLINIATLLGNEFACREPSSSINQWLTNGLLASFSND